MSAILADMWENTEKLVRQELDLAIAQLNARAETLKTDLLTTLTGMAVLYAGLLSIVAACVFLLSRVVEPWLAALIVGLAVSAVGYGMLHWGGKTVAKDAKTESASSGNQIAMTATMKETKK